MNLRIAAFALAILLGLGQSGPVLAQRAISIGGPAHVETLSGGGAVPARPQPTAAAGGTPPAAKSADHVPGNPRLDAASRKLDLRIKRGICTGC